MELFKKGRCLPEGIAGDWGGMVYISMFRRPLLSGLKQIWRSIVELEDKPKLWRAPLKPAVVHEIARFLGLIPLAFINFRADFDSEVTASDASTSGGGVCVSRGLGPFGAAAAVSKARGEQLEDHDMYQILSVGLFDGISALRVALNALQLPVAGHVSVEVNEDARRVVEAFFPDTIFVNNVRGYQA